MRLLSNLCRPQLLKVLRGYSNMTELGNIDTNSKMDDVYKKAENYWNEVASDVDGMLGGFEKLHQPDIADSRQFLMDMRKRNHLPVFDTALDCGAGIGRITKALLLPLFKSVDMVDLTEKFIEDSEKYIGPNNAKIQNKFVEGLQTFTPQQRYYDLIWIQWVIGHLNDKDFVEFLKRCKDGLTENGLIVIKENHASGDKRDFDETDHSWTRTKDEHLELFEQAGLKIVCDRKQKNFPKGMYLVRMYGLKPYCMITALKKKIGGAPVGSNNQVGKNAIRTGGVVPINADLQRKFAHGVNFNMKVVIKGDRLSGKTCLFRRLQGQQFTEAYVPTEEIQVTNITWNYRTSDHIVKVDVWDICDASSRRTTKKIEGLKLDNNSQPSTSVDPDLMICDATFIDVYKNCTGVLLVFDVTKAWTWQYVCKELGNIPSVIPVLVLANKVDLDKQREVYDEEVLKFLTNYKRKEPLHNRLKAPIRFTTCSAKTAHGLKYVYNFLNLPFLFLQREYMENSLESNRREIDIAQQELDCYEGSGDSPTFNHEAHQKVLAARKEESSETNQTNGRTHKKRFSQSSASDDENPVINTFEEDFDSNDECHKTLDAYVAKSATVVSPEQQTFTSFNEILESSAIADFLQPPSNESGQNPLVAKFEDAEDDSETDSQVQSHGSTSCSTAGFTVVRPPKPPKNVSKQPAFKSNPSALEDFLTSPEKSNESRTKKKAKKVSSDKPKKKSTKKNDVTNILVEDQQPMDSKHSDQYDPI
ncbi:Methyltransferase [Aphelenchoides bicaudatus]|nr:Methyltransferase [Aphelenchoides bicaudatus]